MSTGTTPSGRDVGAVVREAVAGETAAAGATGTALGAPQAASRTTAGTTVSIRRITLRHSPR
jgi:hypothetical protein